MDALQNLRLSGPAGRYKSYMLSGCIELSWIIILVVCQALEKKATEGSDPASNKYALYTTVAISAFFIDAFAQVTTLIGQKYILGRMLWYTIGKEYREKVTTLNDDERERRNVNAVVGGAGSAAVEIPTINTKNVV